MKILEKFVLILYSLLVLAIATFLCLVVFKVIDVDTIMGWINFAREDQTTLICVVSAAVICILLSVRCIFFRKRKEIKKSNATEILLENESGRLLISKSAIENAVKNVVNQTIPYKPENKVYVDIDPANNVSVYVSILVTENIGIKNLSLDLQVKIKQAVKDDFDLDVKQVNIKIESNEKDVARLEKVDKKIEDKKEKISERVIDVEAIEMVNPNKATETPVDNEKKEEKVVQNEVETVEEKKPEEVNENVENKVAEEQKSDSQEEKKEEINN